ncbi:MAG: hypothetical protein U0610_04755 [bacterium]
MQHSSRSNHRALRRLAPLVWLALAVPLSGAVQCTYRGLPNPAQPFDTYLDRLAAFLESDVGTGTILEENGQPIPPYFYSFAICDETILPYCSGADQLFVASYPAFTGAMAIRAFLAYYAYAGDAGARDRAIQFADWVLAHRTPSGDVYGDFPYSTTANGVFGALDPDVFPDGPSIELDKAAMFADALLTLYESTDTTSYRSAATTIAATLAQHQRGDGSLPFKVIPSTGAVYVDYTSNQIAFYRLFRHLAALDGDAGYDAAADASWQWILTHPVVTNDWHGFYEDVDDPASKINFDALEVVRELVARAGEDASYLTLADHVFDWIETTFLITSGAYVPLIPSIGEQTGFVLDGQQAGTCSSTIQWALAGFDLGTATDDAFRIRHAAEAANVVNSAQQSDGRSFTVIRDANGGARVYPISWYEQEFIPLEMTLGWLARRPDLAPTDENHLLASASAVTGIGYAPHAVTYSTRAAGTDLLKLVAEPTAITSNGLNVPEVADLGAVNEGYVWDTSAQLLTLKHAGTSQVLTLP